MTTRPLTLRPWQIEALQQHRLRMVVLPLPPSTTSARPREVSDMTSAVNTVPTCGYCGKPIVGAMTFGGGVAFHLECTRGPGYVADSISPRHSGCGAGFTDQQAARRLLDRFSREMADLCDGGTLALVEERAKVTAYRYLLSISEEAPE